MYFNRICRFLLIVFFLIHLDAIQAAKQDSVLQKLVALEASSGGRLGIAAVNTANNQRIEYRSNERFPTGSTFKTIGVAAVLKQSIKNKQLLQQTMLIKEQDCTSWAPITKKQIGQTMSIFNLSAAAIMYSDNGAIHLLHALLLLQKRRELYCMNLRERINSQLYLQHIHLRRTNKIISR